MSKFITLTKVVYDEVGKEFEESTIFVNVDAIAYFDSRVVHLRDGTSFLCKENNNQIIGLITE